MRRFLIAFGLVGTILPANAQDSGKDYSYSVFNGSEIVSQANSSGTEERAVLKAGFPGWMFNLDKISGSVFDMYGRATTVAGNTNVAKAQVLMTTKLNHAGINISEWRTSRNITAPKAAYVDYKQYIDNHEVIFAKLSFRFSPDGKITRIKKQTYGRPMQNASPALSGRQVVDAATVLNDVDVTSITKNTADADWVWFPVPTEKGYVAAAHFTVVRWLVRPE